MPPRTKAPVHFSRRTDIGTLSAASAFWCGLEWSARHKSTFARGLVTCGACKEKVKAARSATLTDTSGRPKARAA